MQSATVMTADVSLFRLAQALGKPIPERHAARAAKTTQEPAMHTTIAIPSDVSLTDLARALGSIGLKAARETGRITTFDHARTGNRPPCQIDDCARDAAASDGPVSLCARHWIDSRRQTN